MTMILDTEKITDGWLEFKTPYNSIYISEFKDSVPHWERLWDSERKVWLVNPEYADLVNKLIKRYFTVDKQTGLTWLQSWRVLHLATTAPGNLIECAANCLLASEDNEAERLKIVKAKKLLLTL